MQAFGGGSSGFVELVLTKPYAYYISGSEPSANALEIKHGLLIHVHGAKGQNLQNDEVTLINPRFDRPTASVGPMRLSQCGVNHGIPKNPYIVPLLWNAD